MMYLIRNQGFFAYKTRSEIVNKYWKPLGTLNDNAKWNLTTGYIEDYICNKVENN